MVAERAGVSLSHSLLHQILNTIAVHSHHVPHRHLALDGQAQGGTAP